MPRIEPEEFGERGTERVFMAGNMQEARTAESLLDEQGFDFCVAPETFAGSGVFGWLNYEGLAFYVASDHAERIREALVKAGLKRGVVEE